LTHYSFWWLKLKALAELKDWDGLETFAKSKKSPIGYEPFVVRRLHELFTLVYRRAAPHVQVPHRPIY
jgi:hypothetical protein